jgi:para-nitrobenzyl esterase
MSKHMRLVQNFAIILIVFASFKPGNEKPNVVKTEAGKVSGVFNKEGDIVSFKGIPFAAPPVGDLRWKAPQPAKPWNGIRTCATFGPSPMQPKPAAFSMWSEEFLIPPTPISEDCLYLNVWTKSKSDKKKAPVLVWIYGGGFNSGGGGVPIYDGEAMAKKGIVFVSINYRVGPFGFFAHPALTQESGYNASGNYGLLDQIAALKWVKNNIAAFGGDTDNVTIAGQSAGSMSVNCLVASPLAKGLFNKAIAESGANFTNANPGLKQAEEEGVQTLQKLGVSSIAGMRKLPAEELLQKVQGRLRPIIDGYVLPDTIANIFKAGKQNDVALLTGWNENEGLLNGPIRKAADFRKQAAERYSEDSATFLKYYPAATDEEASTSQYNLSRDLIFGLQNYTWANVQSSQGKKVYVYRFIRKVPATGEYVKYGAFHTGEVPYAYDNLKFVNRPWEPVDQKLAKVMSSYWVNFITKGDPNGKDLPLWATYTTKDKQVMMLGVEPQSKTIPDQASLDFLSSKIMQSSSR